MKSKARISAIGRITILILLLSGSHYYCCSQEPINDVLSKKVDKEVIKLMSEGGIPGLSLVMMKDGQSIIKSYGYSDPEHIRPVNSHTLFQLGSCSKAFTALAVQKLARDGFIQLNAYVSDYLPWWHVKYHDSVARITLLQLLHHTSGISWQTISLIPASNDENALEETIKAISGISLHNPPGKKYEYATINYDILALIVQTVTKQPFETYLQQHIINALSLRNTTVGNPADSGLMSAGYKIGFFRPRPYSAPVYRGNNAAGYVISNAEDMALWLKFQMGSGTDSALYNLAKATHDRDETVALHGMSSYGMGWNVSLNGNREIYHDGVNPNFTSYIAFSPGKNTGVVVLANSNSTYTDLTGDKIMRMLSGEELPKGYDPGDGNDRVFSILSIITGVYILVVLAFIVLVILDIARGRRRYAGVSAARIKTLALSLGIIVPFLAGIYMLPAAMAGFNWESIFVWTPVSFKILILLIVAAVFSSYLAYFISFLFPEENKFKRIAPKILLLSILSGIANMIVILLITASLNTEVALKYMVFYYILVVSVYLFGNRFVQVSLIRFTRGLIYELRVRLIEKIFSTSYQRFEKMDRGRVYTALNDDVETLGGSADQIISLITNVFTATGAFIYLGSIAFWTALLTILLIVTICTIYYLISNSTNVYFEQARDTRNVFMRLVNGMIDGFKEISLHRSKKLEYKADIAVSANEYKEKISTAGIHFANAFLVGESSLILLLGAVVFAVPKLFPDIQTYTIMSFVIVLLYLIGPVNAILRAVPAVMQLKVAWRRLQKFLHEIPANLDLIKTPVPLVARVESIRAEGLKFQYRNGKEQHCFRVGPIDLEVRSGEILFIIGGNGSGKTTLAKMLTGLYSPDEGKIWINDRVVEDYQLSEYFSAVFSPAFLFPKLYNIDVSAKSDEIKKYLQLLDLDEKVVINGNEYSTIDLSGGQRKRLSLLQCYLEDSPIYLFDEWAADQDPAYRNFFYRTLLPEMKKAGKIVIAITHDDHYFDVADKVLKMKEGNLEAYDGEYLFTSAVSH